MPAVPKATLSQLNSDSFPDNNLGEITPADLRDFNTAMIASLVDEIPFGTYTASQQPTYTALNSFTASQLTINTGVNTTTQSLNGSVTQLNQATASLQNFTSSINQILVNGTSIGTSTRFFFNGFVSASIVPNINGAIASITVLSDPSLATTASFNQFSASINTFTASAKISIDALNSQTASILTSVNALNTFTASDNTSQAALNAFTQSANSRLNSLEAETGSYATTGSNTFNGNQIVSGSFHISGSGADALQIGNGNIYAPTSTFSADVFTGNFVNLYNQYGGVGISLNAAGSGSQYPSFGANVDSTQWPNDIYGGFQIQDPSLGYYTYAAMIANSYTAEYGGQVVGWIGGGGNNTNNSNTALIMRPSSANLEVFKPTVFNFGTTITGSVLGNVGALSITSQTASMDLSQGNFFTLTLVSGSTTHLTATNIKQGQTINLLVTQAAAGSGSLSYNSTFKFNPGNQYTASANGSSQDILTFITFNNSTIYASAIKNLV